jgi:hypothetical protein
MLRCLWKAVVGLWPATAIAPIAHVAAEMGISRACASKWVNRFHSFGELGLEDRSSMPRRQSTATPAGVVSRIEAMPPQRKWFAAWIAFELHSQEAAIRRHTVSRHLGLWDSTDAGLSISTGTSTGSRSCIVASRPDHMVDVDVKEVGRIPDNVPASAPKTSR